MTPVDSVKRQVKITCAEDLFNALSSGDQATQFAVLRAIALNPAKALSYGAFGKDDLPGTLVRMFNCAATDTLRTGVFSALVAIDAPEFLPVYKKAFYLMGCPEILLAAAAKISERPEEEVGTFLKTALFNDAMPEQAQIAANILSHHRSLDHREEIRVALLANHEEVDWPGLNERNVAEWLVELSGRLHFEARLLLEAHCDTAQFRLLRDRWEEMPAAVRAWLLEWGARDFPLLIGELIDASLRSGEDEVLLAALGGLRLRPEFAIHVKPRLLDLIHSDRPEIRLAALEALPAMDAHLLPELGNDTQALLAAMAKLKPTAETQELFFDLLSHERWEVRSLATRKIIEIGPSVLDRIKYLKFGTLSREKVVALAQVLVQLEAEHLLNELKG